METLKHKEEIIIALATSLAIAVLAYGSTRINYPDPDKLPTRTPGHIAPEDYDKEDWEK